MTAGVGTGARLEPYVPRLVIDWLRHTPDANWREVDGSLAFVDISGFTQLTERLARRGKVGAEEMSDLLNSMFAELLGVAYQDGAGLVKWGGDAVLLLFEGDAHAARAVRAAHRMRARLRRVGRLQTPAGLVTLRMSVGIHSGTFHFFLVGDPAIHRELIISGPAASLTAELEALADAGEIAISDATRGLLPAYSVGPAKGAGWLVAREPRLPELGLIPRPPTDGLDIAITLPPPIRTHLLGHSGTAEHRRIAVAFVQFSGTDDVLETDGPAALATALDDAVRNVQEATARHGVTFFESDINRDGGKIMLTSGAPLGTDHAEEAMLRAARRIADRIGRLPLRIGVNSGPVFAGDFGPEFRKTFSVKGDAINLAARVMGKAQAGQVLVTTATLARATSVFEFDELPPFMVKGKSKPVSAVSLLRHLGERRSAEESPMVGREIEMARLRDALAVAETGQGQIVDLVGEPGIGKSRLVAELQHTSAVNSVVIRCDEYEMATAYWPFRNLFRELLGLAEGDGVRAQEQLVELATDVAPHLLPWLPLVGSVLDLAMPVTPEVAALAEGFRKARLEEVVAEFLVSLLTEPTLLVVDDAHLMDSASADLLELLCHAAQMHPWLLLLTRRDLASGFVPTADYSFHSLRPAPLDDVAVNTLIQDALRDRPLPPDDVAALKARAGGNPLFLRGLLVAVRDGAHLSSLPDSVEALISSQIDRLPADDRTVLRIASVLGVSFHQSELAALLQNQPGHPAVDSIGRLGDFLRPADNGQLKFEHQLIRDTAYEGLPFRMRRALHGRAGDVIEASSPEPLDVAELLSLHYFYAEQPEKAWHYSRIAGMRAADKYAFQQADELLTRAVGAAPKVLALPKSELANVLVSLGEARFRTGRSSLALSAFRAARKSLLDTPVRIAVILKREAEIQLWLGRTSLALRTLRRGMTMLEDVDSVAALAALSRLHGAYAVVRESQGRYRDSLHWAQTAESYAVDSGDIGALADAVAAVHGAISMLGANSERNYGQEALDLYEQLGDRVGQSRALNNLAVQSWIQGRGVESLAMFQRAEVLARESGDTIGAASTKYNVADVLVRMGRVKEAQQILREVIPVLQATGIEDFLAAARRALGLALVLGDDQIGGLKLLAEAKSAFIEQREAAEVLETEAAQALAFLLAGQPQQALELADAGAARAEDLAAGYLLPWLLRLAGAAASDLGQLTRAKATLLHAQELADVQSRVELGFIYAELAIVAQRDGDTADGEHYVALGNVAFDLLGFVGSARYLRGTGDSQTV